MATVQVSDSTNLESPTKTKSSSNVFYKVPQIKLNTTDFKPGSVYTSKAEMDAAVKAGKFDINKTMALKGGKLFFLAYE